MAAVVPCTVAGCSTSARARGLCSMHYSRVRRTGSTDPMPRVEDPLGVPALAERVGVTERQVRYWIGEGVLRVPDPRPGSGHALTLPEAEVPVLEAMAELVAVGLSPQAAGRIARALVECGEARVGSLTVRMSEVDGRQGP